MPRTLDSILEAALDAQNFAKPIIRGWFMEDEVRTTSFQILKYKIHFTEIEITFYSATPPQYTICLERGLEIGGIEYTIFTIPFYLTTLTKSRGLWTAKGKLSYNAKHNRPGHVTYNEAIDTWFQLLTASALLTFNYLNPSADWIDYKFLPVGKTILLNNRVENFLSLLKQKYLIFITDYNDLTALVFSVQDSLARSTDHTITLTELDTEVPNISVSKDFRWIDETGAYYSTGAGNNPLHNLGYLESTDLPPITFPSQNGIGLQAKIPFHLKYMTGDKVVFSTPSGVNITCVLDVTEVFEPDSDIAWRLELQALQYLNNTEAGALPSTIERVSNYTPLNTSNFTGVLSDSDNNLQAAMDTIDDHNHGNLAEAIQAPAATNDFLIGAQVSTVWTWVKNTLAQTITVLRTALDAVYAPITVVSALQQLFTHGNNTGIAASTTNYLSFYATGLFAVQANIPTRAAVAQNLYVTTNSAQPASGSLVFTLLKNGSATGITITVAAGAAAATFSDVTHTVAFVDGDLLTLQCVNNATGTSALIIRVRLELAY